MVLQIFFLVVSCLVAYALFAPLTLEIDTNLRLYQFSISPIFKLWWAMDDFLGHLEMSVFGIRKKLPFPKIHRDVTKKKKGKSGLFKFNFHRFYSVIRSFNVKKFIVNIDTGDMPLNGQLFPLMFLFSRITGKIFRINFIGKNEVTLIIKNNAFRILKAYISK